MITAAVRELMGVVLSWSKLLHPASSQVQFGVAGAVDEQEQREVDDLIASFGFPPGFQSSVPAAGDAAGTGPGAPADAPAPGQPDLVDQRAHVRELLEFHTLLLVRGHRSDEDMVWSCRCEKWRGRPTDHVDHVADVVTNLLAAGTRMALATNKFQK